MLQSTIADSAQPPCRMGARNDKVQPGGAIDAGFRMVRSYPVEQLVEVEGGAPAQIRTMIAQKGLGTPTPLIPKHDEKLPFGIHLRRGTEVRDDIACDAMHPHRGPFGSLGAISGGDLPQQGDHPQFLQQDRIE